MPLYTEPSYPDYDLDFAPDESRSAVKHPGRFEGNPGYVPYMWNRLMLWGEYPDTHYTDLAWESYCESVGIEPYTDSNINDVYYEGFPFCDRYRYTVDMFDVMLFPELSEIDHVILWCDDQGFVNSESIDVSEHGIPSHYVYCGL